MRTGERLSDATLRVIRASPSPVKNSAPASSPPPTPLQVNYRRNHSHTQQDGEREREQEGKQQAVQPTSQHTFFKSRPIRCAPRDHFLCLSWSRANHRCRLRLWCLPRLLQSASFGGSRQCKRFLLRPNSWMTMTLRRSRIQRPLLVQQWWLRRLRTLCRP